MTSIRFRTLLVAGLIASVLSSLPAIATAGDYAPFYKGYRGGCIPSVGFGHHRPYRGHISGHIGNHSISAYSRAYAYRESYHAVDRYTGCSRPYYRRHAGATYYQGFSRYGHGGYGHGGYGYGYRSYGYGYGYPSTYARHHGRRSMASHAYVFSSEPTDSTPSWRSRMTAKQEDYEAWKRASARRAAEEKAAEGSAAGEDAKTAPRIAPSNAPAVAARPRNETRAAVTSQERVARTTPSRAAANPARRGSIRYSDDGKRVDGSRAGRRER